MHTILKQKEEKEEEILLVHTLQVLQGLALVVILYNKT
jgi:hypothetical protein